MAVSGDSRAAIEFLRLFNADGPWHLWGKAADTPGNRGETFDLKTEAKMFDWIERGNGKYNTYFHVNPLLRTRKGGKGGKVDIRAGEWLFVDVDADSGKPVAEEITRIEKLFGEDFPKDLPPPTFVTFSGGGFQGFWKLKDPFPINGEEDRWLEYEESNRWLINKLGGDPPCFNADRIMRLPGTINVPNEQKRNKGREVALARLVEFHPERVYNIDQFGKIAQKDPSGPLKDQTGGSGVTVDADIANLPKITDWGILDSYDIPPRLKVIAIHGMDSDNPKEGDNSRSSWVFDFVTNMARAGVPDEFILSLLLDPGFSISESVLESKDPVKYAVRQLERAKLLAIDPNLMAINDRYFVRTEGKVRVYKETYDPIMRHHRLVGQSFDDFRNAYCNRFIETMVGDKVVAVPLGKWWLTHKNRRQYDEIIFAPEVVATDSSYNLWRGWEFTPKEGDCSIFIDHVRRNICAGNPELYEYVMAWMARAIQKPAALGEVALVLRGSRGVGKSLFAKLFGKLFGGHFRHITHSGHLTGNFNAHLRDTICLFADEALFAKDHKHASVLKALITEDEIQIEYKGQDIEQAQNCIHLILASNDDHVVPAGAYERRFVVLDVAEDSRQDHKFFGDLLDQMDAGGSEALMHLLKNWDLSGFNVRDVPHTQALQDQQEMSLNFDEAWWFEVLDSGSLLQDKNWNELQPLPYVEEEYTDRSMRLKERHPSNQVHRGKFLFGVCPELKRTRRMVRLNIMKRHLGKTAEIKGRFWHYILPPLAQAREAWEKQYGPQKWSTTAEAVQEEFEEMVGKTTPPF